MWAVSIPRNLIGPAGYRINRDYARRGWATETGHLNWGPLSWTPLRCRTVEVVRSSCSDSPTPAGADLRVFYFFPKADFSEFRTSRVIAASRGRCVDAWDAVACRVSSKVEGALVLWHYPPPFAFMFCPQADMLA